MKTNRSQELYERAQQFVTAGLHSNSRARAPHPLYFNRADGPTVWDIDGNSYIDLGMGNGAVMLGHNNPAIREAVIQAMLNGMSAGLETETSIRAAELFLSMVRTERVRFTNTGTEAMLHVLHMARAATGRQTMSTPISPPQYAKMNGARKRWVRKLTRDSTQAGVAKQVSRRYPFTASSGCPS